MQHCFSGMGVRWTDTAFTSDSQWAAGYGKLAVAEGQGTSLHVGDPFSLQELPWRCEPGEYIQNVALTADGGAACLCLVVLTNNQYKLVKVRCTDGCVLGECECVCTAPHVADSVTALAGGDVVMLDAGGVFVFTPAAARSGWLIAVAVFAKSVYV